jgi:hypothetical protein
MTDARAEIVQYRTTLLATMEKLNRASELNIEVASKLLAALTRERRMRPNHTYNLRKSPRPSKKAKTKHC